MGFVVHTSAFTAHRSAMPGKLWFPRNRGDKYARKRTFPYRTGMPRVPSSAGYFFDFRELETQWVL